MHTHSTRISLSRCCRSNQYTHRTGISVWYLTPTYIGVVCTERETRQADVIVATRTADIQPSVHRGEWSSTSTDAFPLAVLVVRPTL